MAQDKEKFLSRWSRLKQEAAVPEKIEPETESPAPVLPPVENLTPESDFAGFMHPKVEDALRRVALKKLFSDPHFNVPDPYEPFSGDWTVAEPISEELLATLNQARNLVFDQRKTEEPTRVADKGEAETEIEKDDEPGRKDTESRREDTESRREDTESRREDT
jgi:hypothetical protein